MSNAVYYLRAVIASPTREVSEYLEILRIQLNVAEKIVTDLLNFARIKAPDLQSVSIADVIEEQLSRVDAPDGVRVDREIPQDLSGRERRPRSCRSGAPQPRDERLAGHGGHGPGP